MLIKLTKTTNNQTSRRIAQKIKVNRHPIKIITKVTTIVTRRMTVPSYFTVSPFLIHKEKHKKDPEQTIEIFNMKISLNQLFSYGLPLAYVIYMFINSNNSDQEISYVQFKTNFLEKNMVEKLVVINKQSVRVHLKQDASQLPGQKEYFFTIGSIEAFERSVEESEKERGIQGKDRVSITYANEIGLGSVALNMAPTLLIFGLIFYLSKKAGAGMGGQGGANGKQLSLNLILMIVICIVVLGIFGVGKSKAKLFNQDTDIKMKFKDVAGMDEAKEGKFYLFITLHYSSFP